MDNSIGSIGSIGVNLTALPQNEVIATAASTIGSIGNPCDSNPSLCDTCGGCRE